MAERMISVKLLDDITECPVCTDSYTDPRSLPCVHTFCLKCITKWSADKLSGDNVDCPLCRRSFKIPKEGIGNLPKNIFVAKLLAMKEATSANSTKLCGLCSANRTKSTKKTNNAVAFCVDCQENLCENCHDVHSKLKSTHIHRTVAVEEQFNTPTTCLPAVCGEHPNKDLEFYCFDCQEALCILCSVTQHNGHKSDEITKIVSSFRQDIDKNITELRRTNLQAITRALKNVHDKRTKCVETFDKVEREICAISDELKATIERHKQQLLTELTEMKIRKLKDIDNTIDEITRDKTLLESFVKYSEVLLKRGSDGDIAKESKNLKLTTTEIKQFCEKDHEQLLPETEVTFTPSEETSERRDVSRNLVGFLSCDAQDIANSEIPMPAWGGVFSSSRKPRQAKACEVHGLTNESPTQLCPTLKLSIKGENSVSAICSLNGQLFVTRWDVKEINVYDTSTLTLQRNITASVSSGSLWGLAACTTNNCLYVSDSCSGTVYKLFPTATDLKSASKWSVARGPCGLSLNSSHNLLVACCGAKKVQEYNTNGTLIREISDSNRLWHAIELSRRTIAVSQWGPVHGVLVKSIKGRDIKTYGSTTKGSGSGQMNQPSSLAVDSKGFIIVADECNNRILVLNPALTEARPLPLSRDVKWKWPRALCYEESLGRLYVGEFGEFAKPGRVLVLSNVFNLSSLFGQ